MPNKMHPIVVLCWVLQSIEKNVGPGAIIFNSLIYRPSSIMAGNPNSHPVDNHLHIRLKIKKFVSLCA